MLQLDVQKFLKEGYLFDAAEIGTEELAIGKLGKPDEIEDYDDKGKYLHYDNVRLLFYENRLGGIAMFFMNHESAFEINIDDEVFMLQKSMPLTSLLHMLNKIGLIWTIPYEKSKLDYLLVEVQSGVKIYYYLENNRLERITRDFS